MKENKKSFFLKYFCNSNSIKYISLIILILFIFAISSISILAQTNLNGTSGDAQTNSGIKNDQVENFNKGQDDPAKYVWIPWYHTQCTDPNTYVSVNCQEINKTPSCGPKLQGIMGNTYVDCAWAFGECRDFCYQNWEVNVVGSKQAYTECSSSEQGKQATWEGKTAGPNANAAGYLSCELAATCNTDKKSRQCCAEGETACFGSEIPKRACVDGDFFSDPDKNQYLCTTCNEYKWVGAAEEGTRCCGDDSNEQFCGGNTEGCFNRQYFSDPDLNQFICETCAGAKWLNGRCCGDDGLEDTWNSANTTFGSSCYQGKVILTCGQPENNKAIVNENGSFSLCGVETDPVTNVNFQKGERCSFACSNTLFCSYTGNWFQNSEIGRSHASTWPLNNRTECCEPNTCWNGNSCIENQKDKPTSLPLQGFRCVDGIWKESDIKLALDENSTGYCPEKDQCLVSLEGNADDNNNPEGNPQCISNEQFIKDNFCENGIWTSRTKFIALRLLDILTEDYTLFCDSAENTLNNLGYLIGENEAKEYVGFQRANNFCVLNDNGKIIFATSLNQEINAQNFPFLNVIGISSCTSALIYDDEQYHSCDSSNRVWYNKKTKSVIYSKEAIELGSVNLFDEFISFLKNPFQAIIDKLRGVEAPYDESFVEGLKKFEKLYAQKSGTKFILGSMEGKNFKNLLIEYRNFQTDICNFINIYNKANNDSVSGLVCEKEVNNYYVLGQGSTFTRLDPEKIWQDLTSKLKIN